MAVPTIPQLLLPALEEVHALCEARGLVGAVLDEDGRVVWSGAPARPPARITLQVLGRGSAYLGAEELALSPRQLELVTLLSLHPDGLSLDQLCRQLYGERPVRPTTAKAELSRLRTAVRGHISSRPYCVTAELRADHLDVVACLRAGDLHGALLRYGGSLLPISDAPGIVEWRNYLDVAVRTAVLESGSPEALSTFAAHHPCDAWLQEEQLKLLPREDPRWALAAARLQAT